jgi:hypothetical protein
MLTRELHFTTFVSLSQFNRITKPSQHFINGFMTYKNLGMFVNIGYLLSVALVETRVVFGQTCKYLNLR